MAEKIFISGIDTDAGKTYATGYLARQYKAEGRKVVTVKFIQTGCEITSEDIEKHREIMGESLPEDAEGLTAPIIFSYPASAQLAARLENREINLSLIDNSIEILEKSYDVILIEGAGGLMVPITDDFFSIDFAKNRKLPVILVTNGILGSINHTLLSLEAIKNRNIELKALAYNTFFDKDKIICEDTREFLKRYLIRHFPKASWIEIPAL
ncbi:MAG: ATP-dependent dethiobiotin synthetase BioD [Muribaculaceae bacterium]|nr:ATP-dependent dethiobiotin synthetase BioD [Muribaculaceae bacterium]